MKTLSITLTAVMIVCIAASSYAAEAKRTVSLMAVQGTVQIKPDVGEWVPGRAKTALKQGDFIKTGRDSWALITIEGAGETATVELKEYSNLGLTEIAVNRSSGVTSTLLDLHLGEVMVKASGVERKGSQFEVKTPTSVVAIKGGSAKFSVKVEQVD